MRLKGDVMEATFTCPHCGKEDLHHGFSLEKSGSAKLMCYNCSGDFEVIAVRVEYKMLDEFGYIVDLCD